MNYLDLFHGIGGIMKTLYECKICGKEYLSYNSTSKYCSWECQRKSKKIYIDFYIAKKLYEDGASQSEVAKILNTTQKVIFRVFKENNYKCRIAKKRNQTKENNDYWKGNSAGYSAFHRRIEAMKGKPKKCEVCGTDDESKTYDWANLTGEYNDPSDYKRMCHSKYDKKHLNFRGCKNAM